jgi:hypothetical protein
VTAGAMYALVGAVGLFYFDAINHFEGHHIFVGVLCIGAWHWKRDLLDEQTLFSAAGFLVCLSGFAGLQVKPHYCFGAMVGAGEMMILATWVGMINNTDKVLLLRSTDYVTNRLFFNYVTNRLCYEQIIRS